MCWPAAISSRSTCCPSTRVPAIAFDGSLHGHDVFDTTCSMPAGSPSCGVRHLLFLSCSLIGVIRPLFPRSRGESKIPMNAIVSTARPQQPTLWASLVEAIRGSHQDYTTGSLNRAILLLAVPMVLEMVLESLFAVVDVFWVGRLGANAVATVGLTESLLSLVFAVAMGLSLSTTAMVARRIGEKDPEGAAVAGVQAIALGFFVSVAIGIPCFLYAPNLLRLMGASPEIIATGSGYTRICLGGSFAVLLLFLNNAIFRGAGDA